MSPGEALHPPLKNGRVPFPVVGGRVYVPSREEPHLVGGLAEVVEVRGGKALASRFVRIREHPDYWHSWVEIAPRQVPLWAHHLASRARLPTQEERVLLALEMEDRRTAAEAKRAEAERAARERWSPKKFRCIGGAVVDSPIEWEQHRRGRNWVAVVEYAPTLPGGVDRKFFPRAAGPIRAFVVPLSLSLHQVVEFGADYVQGSGRRLPRRWYGVVVGSSPEAIVLEPCADAAAAFALAASRVGFAQARAEERIVAMQCPEVRS